MIRSVISILFLLLAFVRDSQQITCSGATPKQYLGVCYATCAIAGASYQYRNICYSACPTIAPYDYLGVCYPNCPWIAPNQLTYLQGTSCVTACTTGFADDSTRQCVPTCPSTPILTFKDTTRKICVQMCSTNPSQFADLTSNTCIANCPSPTWGQPDTRICVQTCPYDTYYQTYGSARICTSRCYPNYYADLNRTCVVSLSCPSTPVMYYGDDLSNFCVQECPFNSSTFAQNSTQKCVFFCSLGTFADQISKYCVAECPAGPPRYFGSNITRQCQLLCNEGQFAENLTSQCVLVCPANTYGDYSTRRCVQVCPESQNTFADPLTQLCISLCSPGYYADKNTRSCVVSTSCSGDYVGDPLTLTCVPQRSCPSGYFIHLPNKLCVSRCPSPYWGQIQNRKCLLYCQWLPPNYYSWYQPATRTCVRQCPANPRSFSLNTTQSCVNPCPTGYFGSILTYQCVRTCPDGFHSDQSTNLCVSDCTTTDDQILYMFTPNTTCIANCPQPYFADNITLSCIKVCAQDTYGYEDNRTCLPGCPPGFYAQNLTQTCVQFCPYLSQHYADDSTNMCVEVCPVIPDYYGEDLNDGHRKCVATCTLTSKYADPLTRTCVSQCNVGQGYYAYQSDRRCYLLCPTGYGNPFTGKCTAVCPQNPDILFGDNTTMTCVKDCPNNTYGDSTNRVCVIALDCPTNTFADDQTSLCVPYCSTLLNLFGDPVSKKCVQSCQFGYFADNTTRRCETNCNSSSNYYKDPSTKTCVHVCPSFPDLYAQTSTMSCVDTCAGGLYRLHYSTSVIVTRKCVQICPASPVYYADQQTKTCVTQCANQTYLFVNNTYRGCLRACPPQVYTGSLLVDLYADNTTWKCLAVCPANYFAFKHPSNTSIRICVKICPKIGSVYYFGQIMTRKCVTECPMRLYSTFGDRISMSCVAACPRKQFRNNVTKTCQYSCSSDHFADNTTWRCVLFCPNGTFAQSINRTCVKHCPKDYYAYTRTNQCVQNCSHWRFYSDNTSWRCVTQCPTNPDYYADYATRTCVVRCPGGSFAQYNANTTSVTRMCVGSQNCTDDKVGDPINNRCVPRCTRQPMYFAMPDTKLCGPECFNGLFADNTTGLCVSGCPSPYFGVNSTTYFYCVQYCPANQYKHENTRMCLANCPNGFFADDLTMSCVAQCPDYYYGRTSDNTCVLDCNPLYRDDTTKQCQTACPVNYTASNVTYRCQQKCDYGQFQYNRVCESDCGIFGLFADNLTRKCLPTCPADPWTNADSSSYTCQFVCGGGLYAFEQNRTCLSSCPPDFFKQNTLHLCLNPCLQGQYADINTSSCVTDCLSSNQTFIQPFSRRCVQKCPQIPDLYGHLNNTCIPNCPNGWYAQNFTRTCMQVCPNVSTIFLNHSWADDLTHRCVQRCSALSYAYSNISDNVCLNTCPDGWFASQQSQACVQVCQNGTFAHNTSHTCVRQCPNGQYGDNNTNICVDICRGFYRDNSTNLCAYTCPINPIMFAQDSSMQCVFLCQPNFYGYIENRTCLQDCPSPYFIDTSSQMCVLTCPVHTETFADENIRTCVPSCTNYSINSTTVMFYADVSTLRCVRQCPQFPEMLFGYNSTNQCLNFCPEGTFGDNDTRICMDKCVFQDPKFTWQDNVNNYCVTLCPLHYFADNRTFSCQTSCTVGFFADNSTRRCVVTCPVQPASFGYITNKTCIYNCPTGLFADQITRTCVSVCPTSPFVYYHYTSTNKCVRECIYPYFAQVQSLYCVRRCQDGYYGNLTTKKCQTCKIQCVTCSAYLQCLSCVTGFYLYRYQCVTSCPSYPVMYFAHIQSSICFLQCPPPFFGQTNTGFCHLACPVLYYGNLVTRVCTQCPTGCYTCDASGCYTCLDDYVYVAHSLSCVRQCNSTHIYFFANNCYDTCPNGSYLSAIDLVTCITCAVQCSTCSLTAANCTGCAYKFFYNYRCVDACPTNYFVDSSLSCVSCSLYPDKCVLPPLTYTIHPFTSNYQLHAYVVFNRVVNMTIDQFQQMVQIKYNGQTVRPTQFTSQFYNRTTYWITFRNSTSLNENALSIGFQPGSILDMFGNQLTVNTVQTAFEAQTGVTQQIANNSTKISTATSVFSWILLALVLLFLLKGGYPFLIAIQCIQLFYMFTFIRLSPFPYIQLQFLKSLKNVHFLFLPTFFPQLSGYTITEYSPFLTNTSFLYNSSPFILLVGFSIVVYLIFLILSSKSLISNKSVRQTSKKIKKYRLKYGLFNDVIWFVYIYAMFMSVLQFTQASVADTWNTINIVFAALVFVFLMVYTVFMIYLGNKYKDPKKKLPTKWSFLRQQPSQFPMQIPMRYFRRLIFCCALVIGQVDAQCIIIIMSCLLFLIFLLCYLPSSSAVTNAVNITIQTSYIVIAGMYYGFNKLEEKNLEEQVGFAISLVVIKGLILLGIIGWIVYRGVLVIRQTQTWQRIFNKITQNKDPQYLKQQQRKRDLQFDWGQFQNRSQQQKTDHQIGQNSSSRGIKLLKDQQKNNNIFDLKEEDQISQEFAGEQKIKGMNFKDSASSYDGSGIGENNSKFIPNRTQKIPKRKKNANLQILDIDNSRQVSQLQLLSSNSNQYVNNQKQKNKNKNKKEPIDKLAQLLKAKKQQKVKKQQRAIWDDIQFDEHQI